MGDLNRIYIIGHFEGAANNRTDLEEKGLLSSGVNCIKINLLPYVRSRFLYPIRLLKSLSFLFTIKKRDAVIIYGESPFFIVDTFFLKLKKCKIVFERTEYPNFLIYQVDNEKLKQKSYTFLKNLRHASGFITCSDALVNYYKKFLPQECSVLKLPLLVDSGKFEIESEQLFDFRYIAYCGHMGNDKDGVSTLIEAFKQIATFYPINLVLIGNASEHEILRLKEQARGLEDRIIFTGTIKHDNMPRYISSADILALARPNNKQAEGGFPSKLGEYLATGKPVLVTSVGEIPSYIIDGENGYLSPPDRADLFADKLKSILDNYDGAKIVGERGKELAKYFNYPSQGLMLKNYLKKI